MTKDATGNYQNPLLNTHLFSTFLLPTRSATRSSVALIASFGCCANLPRMLINVGGRLLQWMGANILLFENLDNGYFGEVAPLNRSFELVHELWCNQALRFGWSRWECRI